MPNEERFELPPWVTVPPTADDLPSDDGEPMETYDHRAGGNLLMDPLEDHWADRDDVFIGGNMFVYFSMLQVRKNDFRGPDVFIVKDTTRGSRKSWVVWDEGKAPEVVIELSSPSTVDMDRGDKKRIYEHVLRVPEYFIFEMETCAFEGYRLSGGRYLPIEPDEEGRLASEQTGLRLGIWDGKYKESDRRWIRWFTPDGRVLPTPQERAQHEAERAARAEAKAENEAQARAALEAELAALRRTGGQTGGQV